MSFFSHCDLDDPKMFEFLHEENDNLIVTSNKYEILNDNTNDTTYNKDDNSNSKRKKILNISSSHFEIISKKKYYYTPKPKIKIEEESKIKIENNMLNKKRHGRKSKDSNEKGERDKFAKDNIEKKIKTIFFKYCMDEIIKRAFNINRKLPHEIKIDNNKVMKEVFYDYKIGEIYCVTNRIDSLNENKKQIANMYIYQIFEQFLNNNFEEFIMKLGIYNIKPFYNYLEDPKEKDEAYTNVLKENFLNYLKVLKEGQTRKNRKDHINLIERLKKIYNEN